MKSFTGFKIPILFLVLLLPVREIGAQSVSPWENLKAAYAAYVKNPSARNAKKVSEIVPQCANPPAGTPGSSSGESAGVSDQEDAEDYLMAHLGTLEKRMKEGNRASFQLAYQLFSISDGEFSEELAEILDKPIHSNPELFLEELKENQAELQQSGRFENLLTFMGPQFADQAGQPLKEYQSRIRALRKVRKASLKTFRDQCIDVIHNEFIHAE
jgi:hypothetical protein